LNYLKNKNRNRNSDEEEDEDMDMDNEDDDYSDNRLGYGKNPNDPCANVQMVEEITCGHNNPPCDDNSYGMPGIFRLNLGLSTNSNMPFSKLI
jgi:hypothetical protein